MLYINIILSSKIAILARMKIDLLLKTYNTFKEKSLYNRLFKHQDIESLIAVLPPVFNVETIGFSAEQRKLQLIKWGKGKTKVFLWSQMHGDEATGTMALFDLIIFLQKTEYQSIAKLLSENSQLFILPMVNPDGAAHFSRRNAQQIDVNRDYLQYVTPEAKLLKQVRDTINPDFGFNLHDQSTLWSVANYGKPATLSFLAPAFDADLNINPTREKAMQVIADIFDCLNPILPQQIGLFNDEHEPRAFGDNFQKAGTATILVEAGGLANDEEKQEIRKFYFQAILSGLISIASNRYKHQSNENYFSIPKNTKNIFHILIKNVLYDGIKLDIGINYEEKPINKGTAVQKTHTITDMGDLSTFNAYKVFEGVSFYLQGKILFNKEANFDLLDQEQIILSFKNGILA